MKLIVNPHKIEIDKTPINEREIDITKCEFEFADEITQNYVKEAYFTFKDKTYKEIIVNNECNIPNEVLTEKGQVEIGVVAYLVENEEEIKRYNPSPAYFNTWLGSLKDNAENSEPITPSEMEQFEQALQDGLVELDTAVQNAERLDIDVSKEGTVTTVEITKQDGTVKSEQILDGEKGDKGDKGDKGIPGEDGYTPIKGIDYWTNTDKSEVESDIISDITPILNNKADKSEIPNVSNFITKDVNNLTNYTLKTSTGSLIDLSINTLDYVVTLNLKNQDGTVISTDTIDLPLESVVVSGRYDNNTKKVILTLENGSEVDFSVADLVAGLQTEITSSNKLDSDLVDDTNSGNKFVTTSEKDTWNAKGSYSKPNDGIPKTDLDSSVQTSLGKADTAIQTHQSLAGYVKKDDDAGQTISLVSGTGTTPLGLKSMATSSYISFSNNTGWLGSIGVTPDKKPAFYNNTSYALATTSDITNAFENETKWAWYGTSTTAAATQAKVVTCAGFKLTTGAVIFVRFSNGQTYNGAPTLNVNSTGAKTVQYKGGSSGIQYMWSAGEIVGFVYDGTYWVAIEKALATSTYYGVTKLSTSGTSSSTSVATTPSVLYNIMSNIVAGLPVYSASSTYSVGDRVRYGTSWYECNTDISEAEAWDADHWTKIDDLLTQVDNKVDKTSFVYDNATETLTITIS